MTKRFCDRCGKEVGVYKDIEFQTWWTITRHGMLDLTTELCDACYQQTRFVADTPQTNLVEDSDDLVKDLVKDTPQTEELKCRNGREYKACEYEDNCNPIVCFKALDELAEMLKDEPQTDCDRYAIVNDEGERAYNCIGCQTDCPWK